MELKKILKKYTDLKTVNAGLSCLWIPFLAIYLVYSLSLLKYPYEWEPGEGSKILYAQRLIEGKPIYKSNQSFPMLGNCYPPVYTFAIAPFVKIGGPLLIWGRLVSVIAILIMCLLIYKTARETTGSACLGITASSCFVFIPIISSWYSLARMDSLCSMFLMLSAYILFKHRHSVQAVFISAVCAVLAVYTKQTAVFAVLAVLVYLVYAKRYKDLFMFFAVLAVLSLAVFVALQWYTQGWFYKNVVAENVHRVFFMRRYYTFFGWVLTYAPFIILISVYGLFKKSTCRKTDIWPFYFAGGLFNALLIGANGSGYNYFFTLWSAVSIFYAQGIAYAQNLIAPHWSGKKSWLKLSLIGAVILVSLINFQGGTPGLIYRDSLIEFMPSQSALQAMRRLEIYIRNSKGNIFVDRFPSITLRYDNKSGFYMEPAFIQELFYSGNWDPSAMIKMIENKKFSAIFLMSESLVPYPVKETVKEHYFAVNTIPIGSFEVWRDQYVIVYYPKK